MALPVHGLFQKRVDGDDALLRLARRRFEEAGMAAEVYAGSPEELDRILRFAPQEPTQPVVHLPRDVDLLAAHDRRRIQALAESGAGRVRGFVVHDRRGMPDRLDDLAVAAEEVSPVLAGTGTLLFLEYAVGCTPDEFVAMASALAPFARVGTCVDIGHVGVRQARRAFERRRPDLAVDLAELTPGDERLPAIVDDVVAACAAALPTVLDLIDRLAALGGPLHHHLHDGHPLHPGLADHRSFLTRIAVPFEHRGRRSLDPLFGPAGLSAVIAAVHAARGPARAVEVSLTLEIHQGNGRLPVPEAGALFGHWRDLTNAERMNAWLAVLSENAQLVEAASPSGES